MVRKGRRSRAHTHFLPKHHMASMVACSLAHRGTLSVAAYTHAQLAAYRQRLTPNSRPLYLLRFLDLSTTLRIFFSYFN